MFTARYELSLNIINVFVFKVLINTRKSAGTVFDFVLLFPYIATYHNRTATKYSDLLLRVLRYLFVSSLRKADCRNMWQPYNVKYIYMGLVAQSV